MEYYIGYGLLLVPIMIVTPMYLDQVVLNGGPPFTIVYSYCKFHNVSRKNK